METSLVNTIGKHIAILFCLLVLHYDLFSQNDDWRLDTLFIKNTNTISKYPIISDSSGIYNLLGNPNKITKRDFFCGSIRNIYTSYHYLWNNIYYIKINDIWYLLNMLFDNDVLLKTNKIMLSNKTSLQEIIDLFPYSFENRHNLSYLSSSYNIEREEADLISIPFMTEYGIIYLIFRNGKLFYLETYLEDFLCGNVSN